MTHSITRLDLNRTATARTSLDGRAALRFGIALILIWFGYMKFLPYEAEGVAGLAQTYWLFGWMYPLIGVAGASIVIGVLEITGGVLIALGGRFAWAGLVGALMGTATFVVTLSFFFTAPGIVHEGYAFPALGSTGQFLAKDIGLLAICVFLALDARARLTRP
ncbi:DUF417 family protein [Brevundimonas sp.]|uniref:YkgB family protein n=1 Tax=Brevundimonas sp. TaxID=1871086 RepID=UPI001A33935B|nr:DUF417 family protein [Brevundimonas sp.]MBJ7484501.1 DUF417 family protein [Brevundimonas sp.]